MTGFIHFHQSVPENRLSILLEQAGWGSIFVAHRSQPVVTEKSNALKSFFSDGGSKREAIQFGCENQNESDIRVTAVPLRNNELGAIQSAMSKISEFFFS
jgi:hypothetical protein